MSDATLTVTADGLTIERGIDAPPQAVWAALTEPGLFASWFGKPTSNVPVESVSLDLRPDGAWRATMIVTATGGEIPWRGRYREVASPDRLSFTLSDAPGAEFELITFELAEADATGEAGRRTRLTCRQEGGHLSEEQYSRAGAGWLGFLEALAEVSARA